MIHLFVKHPLYNFMFLVYPVVGYVLFWGVARRDREDGVRDITGRLGGIIWSSFECGYFAGILPLGFLQHEYLSFDLLRCTLVIVYLCVNSFVLFMSNLLETSFMEIRFRLKNVGCWTRCAAPPQNALGVDKGAGGKKKKRAKPLRWDGHQCPYSRGAVVEYNGRYYVALADKNEVRPGRWLATIVYCLFENPSRTHTGLIMLQVGVVLSQLVILMNSRHLVAYGVMLVFSYCILYRCIRVRRMNLPYFPRREKISPTMNTPKH